MCYFIFILHVAELNIRRSPNFGSSLLGMYLPTRDYLILLILHCVYVLLAFRFANVFMHKVNEDIAPGYHSIVHRSVKTMHQFS